MNNKMLKMYMEIMGIESGDLDSVNWKSVSNAYNNISRSSVLDSSVDNLIYDFEYQKDSQSCAGV